MRLGASRRPGDRHAHQLVRDGVPHAGQRAGADGPLAASRSTCSRCTAPSRASRRSPTTACWPGGWSSAACGSSQIFHEAWDQHGDLVERPEGELQGDRPGQRRAGQGPEAARPARRHAGDLGRRVRPHADGAGRQRRPRPSPERVHDVAGRRRHQAGHHARRDRRVRLQRRSRTRSTSTTCTRRSCTCWASTTRS